MGKHPGGLWPLWLSVRLTKIFREEDRSCLKAGLTIRRVSRMILQCENQYKKEVLLSCAVRSNTTAANQVYDDNCVSDRRQIKNTEVHAFCMIMTSLKCSHKRCDSLFDYTKNLYKECLR